MKKANTHILIKGKSGKKGVLEFLTLSFDVLVMSWLLNKERKKERHVCFVMKGKKRYDKFLQCLLCPLSPACQPIPYNVRLDYTIIMINLFI